MPPSGEEADASPPAGDTTEGALQAEPARPPSVEPGPEPAKRPRRTRPASRPTPRGPRRVLFKPYPVNVSIAVDDGPLKPLGPDFQSVELSPGRHSFRFVGGRDCCEDKRLTVDVPPGPGITVLEPRLNFRPARLYVVSNVPADVKVGNGVASGRARSVINVPVERSLIEPHRISVTAPGYEPYTGNVSLRAGKVKQVRVDLEPSGTPPP